MTQCKAWQCSDKDKVEVEELNYAILRLPSLPSLCLPVSRAGADSLTTFVTVAGLQWIC